MEDDGSSQVMSFNNHMVQSFHGMTFTHIKCLSKHRFRFASDFEAGMMCQEATIYTETKDGKKISLEHEGWNKEWIILFDKI